MLISVQPLEGHENTVRHQFCTLTIFTVHPESQASQLIVYLSFNDPLVSESDLAKFAERLEFFIMSKTFSCNIDPPRSDGYVW
jgi:hypothetical protein